MSSSRKGKRGRYPFYRTPEEMQEKIDQYFEECKGEVLVIEGSPVFDKYGQPIIINARPPTITGLTFALGFVSRQSLIDYADKKAFTDTVLRAKLRIEAYNESRLFDRDGARGAEFNLKYNFGWADKPDIPTATVAQGVIILPGIGGAASDEQSGKE